MKMFFVSIYFLFLLLNCMSVQQKNLELEKSMEEESLEHQTELVSDLKKQISLLKFSNAENILFEIHKNQVKMILAISESNGKMLLGEVLASILSFEELTILPILQDLSHRNKVDFSAGKILKVIETLLESRLSQKDIHLIKDLYIYCAGCNEYYHYIEQNSKYPDELTVLKGCATNGTNVKYINNRIEWNNKICFLDISECDLPLAIRKLIHKRIIIKNGASEISRQSKSIALFSISENELSSILAHLPLIEKVCIFKSQINCKQILFPKTIKHIFFYGSSVSELKFMNIKESVTDLTLRGCYVDEFQDISEFIELRFLDVSNTTFSKSDSLSSLTKLERLEADFTNIKSLNGLKCYSTLHSLFVRNTKIKEIETLKNFVNLQHLHISNTSITDLSPLYNLKNLKYIAFLENDISLKDVALLKEHLQQNSSQCFVVGGK